MSAEMSARRTAAAAVVADFAAAANGFVAGDKPEPPWPDWSWRLAGELRSVLAQLDADKADEVFTRPQPHPAAAQLAAIRLVLDQVLGDELADRQYALEQIHDVLRGDL